MIPDTFHFAQRLLFILNFTLFTFHLAAQPLTIEECRRLALEHNKKSQIASLTTQQAVLTSRSTRAMFLPDFSLTGIAAYSTASGTFGLDISGILPTVQALGPSLLSNTLQTAVASGQMTPAAAQQMGQTLQQQMAGLSPKADLLDYKVGWVYHGGVTMKQPLYMGGKILAGYRMSQLAVDLYRQNERKTQAEVIEDADQAYATLVKAAELKAVAEKYRDVLQELDRNVESAVRHGMRLESDRLKVQVKLSEVELQIRKAENGIRLAQMNLCHVIGRPLSERPTVSSQYPRVDDAATIMASDVMQRPEYAMLQGKAQIESEQVKVTRSTMLPQLALLASYGYTGGLEVNGRNFLDGANFTGGVTLSVPLYHFGERTSKVKAARLKAEQARLEQEEKAELMLLELTQCANQLDESQLECQLADKQLEQAEKSMTVSQKQYQSGTETLSDYLEAQALWQSAHQTRVEAYFQRYLSSVRYLKAAGRLVE